MHHGKSEILRGLDPSNPSTIQALIDFHRSTFGGWVMDGEDPAGATATVTPPATTDPTGSGKADDGATDEKLGDAGMKALQTERDARKAMEAQLNTLKAGLASALGIESKDAKSSTDDVLASIQEQMASMQHENLVLTVANTHKITDEDDLSLLRDFKGNEEALRKLAGRLKPSDKQEEAAPPKRRSPGPDHSQGRGNNSDARPGDAGRAEAARRFKKQ